MKQYTATERGSDTMPFGFFKTAKKPHEMPHADAVDETRIVNISPKLISPNPSQPRCDFDADAIVSLADSISKYGFIQPLCVRVSEEGTYELIAGERRLRAAKLLGLERVPCIVVPRGTDRKRSAELAIVENIQRENLNFFEQAAAIRELMYLCSYTQTEAAERLSLSQSAVANKLRLLKLGKSERAAVLAAKLTERHARALLAAPQEKRMTIITLASELSLGVAQTECLARFAADNDDCDDASLESEAKRIKCRAETAYNNGKKSAQSDAKRECGSKPRVKIAVRDLGIFVNSFEHLAELAERTGAVVEKSIDETGGGVEFRMRITPNPPEESGDA